MDLSSLVPMLASQGVSKFEGYGVKLEFHRSVRTKGGDGGGEQLTAPPISIQPPTGGQIPVAPEPPDLRADDTMSADDILNWSAPQNAGDAGSLPLTGDAPLPMPEGAPV